jgi:hypothetical protein
LTLGSVEGSEDGAIEGSNEGASLGPPRVGGKLGISLGVEDGSKNGVVGVDGSSLGSSLGRSEGSSLGSALSSVLGAVLGTVLGAAALGGAALGSAALGSSVRFGDGVGAALTGQMAMDANTTTSSSKRHAGKKAPRGGVENFMARSLNLWQCGRRVWTILRIFFVGCSHNIRTFSSRLAPKR